MYAVIFNNKDLKNPTQVINGVKDIRATKAGIVIIHPKYVNTTTQINVTVKVYNDMGNLVSTFTHDNVPML